MTTTITPTATGACTVVVGATGGRCGAAATYKLVVRGRTYYECAEHAMVPTTVPPAPAPAEHPPTKTTKPYVLVREGEIVGYAEAVTEAVEKRARRLDAKIVAVTR